MGHAEQKNDQGPVWQIKGQRDHSGKQKNKVRDQKRKAKQQKKKKELLPSLSLTLTDSLFFSIIPIHCKPHPLPIPNGTIEKIRGRQGGMEQLHSTLEKRNSSYKNAAIHTLKGGGTRAEKRKSISPSKEFYILTANTPLIPHRQQINTRKRRNTATRNQKQRGTIQKTEITFFLSVPTIAAAFFLTPSNPPSNTSTINSKTN